MKVVCKCLQLLTKLLSILQTEIKSKKHRPIDCQIPSWKVEPSFNKPSWKHIIKSEASFAYFSRLHVYKSCGICIITLRMVSFYWNSIFKNQRLRFCIIWIWHWDWWKNKADTTSKLLLVRCLHLSMLSFQVECIFTSKRKSPWMKVMICAYY